MNYQPIKSKYDAYKIYPKYLPTMNLEVEEIDKKEILDIEGLKYQFFHYKSLLSIIKTDLSSVYPSFETKSETSLIVEIIEEKGVNIPRLSKIVDRLIKENEAFKIIDKPKLIEFFSDMIKRLPFEQMTFITDDELTQRIEKIIAIEALSGILSDLSPEQIEAFNIAVKRREFFK